MPHSVKLLGAQLPYMSKSADQRNVEEEELLEGQNVFKGPRKLRTNLLNGSTEERNEE